ncbi:hypothetical protein FRC11_008431 [Ceratobasidium sp. 423]|nr:hypothetical protein FRC11_008431 [Ceratobasidium sp. 423]
MSDPTAEFTMEENKFLEKYMDENNKINELGPKRKIKVDRHKTTWIEDFLDCISKPFLKKFPYQDPATAKSKIKPDLCKLQYSEVDWPQNFQKHILRRFAQFRWCEKNRAQWVGETNEQSEEDEEEDEDEEGTNYNSGSAEDDKGEDIGDMEGTHKQESNKESGERDINEQQAHYKHDPRSEDEEMLEGSPGNAGSTSEPTKSTELIAEAHDDGRAMGEEAGHPALWPQGPTYSSVSIEWQGGSSHTPYGLIEEEHQCGKYTIVTQAVLPMGVEYLKNPMLMSKDEIAAISEHLIAGDMDLLPADRVSQFNQCTEGNFEEYGAKPGEWDTHVVYGPDSLMFVKAMEATQVEYQSRMPQGHPLIPASSVLYQLFNNAALAMYHKTITDDDTWWGLQAALKDHDMVFLVTVCGDQFNVDP